MKKNINELRNHLTVNDGSYGTFYDKKEKYNGIVYEIFNGKLSWIFEVKDGVQNGISKTFHVGTNTVEQVLELKDNWSHGVSKEYDENGSLTNVAILLDDRWYKSIALQNEKILKIEEYDVSDVAKLPEHIQNLLKLTNEALISYEFDSIDEDVNMDDFSNKQSFLTKIFNFIKNFKYEFYDSIFYKK